MQNFFKPAMKQAIISHQHKKQEIQLFQTNGWNKQSFRWIILNKSQRKYYISSSYKNSHKNLYKIVVVHGEAMVILANLLP